MSDERSTNEQIISRPATTAESLGVLLDRHRENLSPAERRHLAEAITLANERDTWKELAQNAEARLRSSTAGGNDLERAAALCDEYAADTEQRKNEERGYWTAEAQAVFRAQKELAKAIRALPRSASSNHSSDSDGLCPKHGLIPPCDLCKKS